MLDAGVSLFGIHREAMSLKALPVLYFGKNILSYVDNGFIIETHKQS